MQLNGQNLSCRLYNHNPNKFMLSLPAHGNQLHLHIYSMQSGASEQILANRGCLSLRVGLLLSELACSMPGGDVAVGIKGHL